MKWKNSWLYKLWKKLFTMNNEGKQYLNWEDGKLGDVKGWDTATFTDDNDLIKNAKLDDNVLLRFIYNFGNKRARFNFTRLHGWKTTSNKNGKYQAMLVMHHLKDGVWHGGIVRAVYTGRIEELSYNMHKKASTVDSDMFKSGDLIAYTMVSMDGTKRSNMAVGKWH